MARRGRKKGYKTPDEIREKIQGSLLIKRLQDNVADECLSTSQVNSAKILLSKIIPDLKAVEHKGEIEHTISDDLASIIAGARGSKKIGE